MGVSRLAVHTHLRLPQEVVDMIIDFVDARADWKHCARVCWSWVHASQLHLFRSVSISIIVLDGEEEPPVARLKSVLDRAPHLAKHVRELEIVRDFGQCFNIRMQEQLLSLLIPLFPRIQTFSLKSVDCDQEFRIDASLLAAIQCVLHSPLLNRITLFGWDFEDTAHLTTLLGDEIQSLHTFNIDTVNFNHRRPPLKRSVPKDGLPAILDTLTISSSIQGVDAWFDSLKHPVIVKKLVLNGWGASSPILQRFAKDLEELSLIMEDDDEPFTDFHRFKQLTKLSLNFSIDFLEELQTIPEDNCLQNLELLDLSFWELSRASSIYKLLDEFLASKHFSRLKTVMMVVGMQPSLTAEEFKLLRKTMRRIIGKGILHLRFRATGETLHSMQIQDQASRREIFLPSDFPWFVEALQVEEEEEDDDEDDEEVFEVDTRWKGKGRMEEPEPFSQQSSTTWLPSVPTPPSESWAHLFNLQSNDLDALFACDFDTLFGISDHPGLEASVAYPDPSAAGSYHGSTAPPPSSELTSNGSWVGSCWSQPFQQFPSSTRSDLAIRGQSDLASPWIGQNQQNYVSTSAADTHIPSASNFSYSSVPSTATCSQFTSAPSNSNGGVQSSPCPAPGSSVYSYFPYENSATSSKTPDTTTTYHASATSTHSHTYPSSSTSNPTWSTQSDAIQYGNCSANTPQITSNLEYPYSSGDVTDAPANQEAYTAPIPHSQIPQDSPPSLPPQTQFPSIPQIPAPSNPSYYKSTVEYIEDSLFTTVTEVVNTSPYHRQVWFSQTPATESGTSGHGPYDFPPANFSSAYPP